MFSHYSETVIPSHHSVTASKMHAGVHKSSLRTIIWLSFDSGEWPPSFCNEGDKLQFPFFMENIRKLCNPKVLVHFASFHHNHKKKQIEFVNDIADAVSLRMYHVLSPTRSFIMHSMKNNFKVRRKLIKNFCFRSLTVIPSRVEWPYAGNMCKHAETHKNKIYSSFYGLLSTHDEQLVWKLIKPRKINKWL